MFKRSFLVVLIIFVFISLLWMSLPEQNQGLNNGPRAINGKIDLADWNIDQMKSLRLDGEWEFYWGQLLTPADFHKQGANKPIPSGYMQVPGLWNGKVIDEDTLPNFGCATYRLVLKNLAYDGTLGLKKGNVRFSSRVYVNGRDLYADGIPALQAAEYKSGNTPQLGFFSGNGGNIEILVQAANFEYINSGIPVSFELGRESSMLHQYQTSYSFSLAVFVILLTIAFLYFIFFAVARWNGIIEYLMPLFSLFCILFAIGNALADQRPLLLMFPHLSFTLAFKMKDFFLTANFIIVLWIFHLFKRELLPMRRLIYIISFTYGIYLIGILLLPIHVYIRIHLIVMACNTVILLLLLIQFALMYIKKSEGFLLFIAILAVNLYSADAILFSLGFKTSSSFLQVYIMFFAAVMMFLLSMQYFTAIRCLQNSMKRTQDAEISFLRAQINPHFLYNALNSIAALCATDPIKAEDVVVELSQYLRRSFDFKRMDAMSTLSKEKELLEAYLYIEKMRFGERLQVKYDIDETLNIQIPPLILQPLVENAVRHGVMEYISGGTVTISIRRQKDEAVFIIEDNGVGIDQERVETLLEEKPKEGGIGVWNINQRLKMLYNRKLTVYSEKGQGTKVIFSLPLHHEKIFRRRSGRKEINKHESNYSG